MPSPKLQVSENHRRVLSARLRTLEESALALLDLFEAVDNAFTERDALPEERKADVRRLVGTLRSRIEEIKTDLELERTRLEAKRYANAVVVAMSVNVEELHPNYLKGYGKVPEDLARYLRSEVNQLLGLLREIRQALGAVYTEVRPEG